MRISGLASGIDTDTMVQQMMQVERMKVDRVEQDKQLTTWRQEAFNDLNKEFANFILNTRKSFGLTSTALNGTFRTNSYQNLDWVKGATSSNEQAATVSSTSKVMDGSYDVEVKQLAKGVSLASGSNIKDSLVDKDGKLNNEEPMEFIVNDGNHDFTIKVKADASMSDVVKAINNAKTETGTGKDKKTESIGVRASYDHGQGRFFLQTTNTGADTQITIKTENDGTQNFLDGLNLTNGEEGYNIKDGSKGQDALINFNGAKGIVSHSNNVTVNGITMNLKAVENFTVTVATDVDAVYEKIEEFVEEYNKLVDKTNKLVGEKEYRSFHPLSAEEKKAMTEDDVKLWEEKAKSGLLSRDSTIQQTMLNIRQSLYAETSEIDGTYSFITQIGISTEEYSQGTAGGRLKIDEDKLRKAIANDAESVMELMFKESSDPIKDENGKVIGGRGGLLTRVHEGLMDGMESIVKKSGPGTEADLYTKVRFGMLTDFRTSQGGISALDRELLNYNKKIDQLNIMLGKREDTYYARFTAMEKAIAKMNQQSSWLQQQMMMG